MKKNIITTLFILLGLISATAQDGNDRQQKRPRFSPEQFQIKQREYITEKAALNEEEADAFFPLFFELQKEKFRIEREARSKVIKERGQRLTDEECKELLSHTADAKIKIAKLEKEYITKYLNTISPKKLLDIERAEHSFQGHMIKSMVHGKSDKEHHKRKEGVKK